MGVTRFAARIAGYAPSEVSLEFSRRTFSTLAGTAVLGLALGGAGAGAPAATSRRAVPTGPPPRRPRADGARHGVGFDRHSLVVDGRRLVLWSGEMPLFGLPSPSLWRDMLQKLRAYGYNTVSVPVAWNYHSPAPGQYDFSGVRDLDLFLRMATETGLYVVLRPGPYLGAGAGRGPGAGPCAGTGAGTVSDGSGIDAGGLPGWLTAAAGRARSSDPAYLRHADAWLAAVDEIAVRHLHTQGRGTVLLYQLETPYGAAVSADHLTHLYDKVRADGIDVPVFHRGGATPGFVQAAGAGTPGVPGALGDQGAPGTPDPASSRRYLRLTALADGITAFDDRTAVGCPAWGWLPVTSTPYVSESTSFDEARVATPTAAAMHQLGHLLGSVPDLAKLEPAEDVKAESRAGDRVTVRHLTNPDTGAHAYVVSNDGDEESSTELPVPGASLPVTLPGHDARVLLADVRIPNRRLRFTTAQLMWAAAVGAQDVAVFAGRRGETVEVVIECADLPVPSRLDEEPAWSYDRGLMHVAVPLGEGGLARVRVEQGGSDRPLLLLFADKETSVRLWPYETPDGDVLVYGPALLRKAEVDGRTLRLTGDVKGLTGLETWGPKKLKEISWNGSSLPVRTTSSGGLALQAPLPKVGAVPLPDLTGWRRRDENPESDPRFDDTRWTVAGRTTSYSITPAPDTGPVLFADDYGFHYGDVWYRGRFKNARHVRRVSLSYGAGTQGLLTAWLDGEPLGTHEMPSPGKGTVPRGTSTTTASFQVPHHLRTPGAHVLSVLVRPMAHAQDDDADDAHKAARGLTGVSFTGAAPSVGWRIQGAAAPDPVRGPLNNGGLFGEREGWHLPGLDDHDWTAVKGVEDDRERQGVTWYRTRFRLDVKPSLDESVGLALTDHDPERAYRVQVFLNGWNMGQYVNGPAARGTFVLPNGLLRTDGMPNTLALAVLTNGGTPSGPDEVWLRLLGVTEGGVPVNTVTSPGGRR